MGLGVQIEYAAKAVDNSGTVIGIKCKDGIVMGVEKLVAAKMMLPGSNKRIHPVHRHSGMIRRTDLVEDEKLEFKELKRMMREWSFSKELKRSWKVEDGSMWKMRKEAFPLR